MVRDFDEARAAGFTPKRAARWAAYLRFKAERAEAPITLTEAVAQVAAARS
jgi:hypothetical protein